MTLPPVDLSLNGVSTCNYDRLTLKHSVHVEDGVFTNSVQTKKNYDLSGYTLYPGLINAHDHLLGTYYPRVGNGPYICWKPWDVDLKTAKLYHERNRLSIKNIYLLGYYRQILSGVTTVCDHIPHLINEEHIEDAYVRIVEQYCIAHEISSYELTWGASHELEIQKSKRYNIPFITHIEEGFDGESLRGVEDLHAKSGIYKNSVLVHCLSCNEHDIALIANKQASMVWCPNSNLFMFDRTANIRKFIEEGVNVCLGTDSPMSGGLHLLDEMKTAQAIYYRLYKEPLSAQLIFKMVTDNPARAFKLDHLIGKVEAGKKADFVIVRLPSVHNPYEKIIRAQLDDIEIVVRQGIPLYFHEKHKHLFYEDKLLKKHYERVRIHGKRSSFIAYLIGRPLRLKSIIEKSARFKKKIAFFPIEAP